MAQVDFLLIDELLAPGGQAVAGVEPELAVWSRSHTVGAAPTLITHNLMYRHDYRSIPMDQRYGLLLESQSIIPRVYQRVRRVIPDYEMVFTHSSKLLSEFPNTRWIPGGGIWVGGSYGGGTIGITPKTRMVSMLSSNKSQVPLHRKRLRWAKRLQRAKCPVDVFLQGRGSSDIVPVYDTLKDYRYSIVVENFIDDAYFTEKLLNCFATGTVPIYLGASKLGRFFNVEGVIQFRDWRQLHGVLRSIVSDADYRSRIHAIEENFDRSLAFRTLEDYIHRTHLEGP